jgi:hypothetical protein
MATPPLELQTCAEQVARLLGRDDATPASLKLLVAPHHSIKSLWGRLVRGRPAVLLQRAVTLAQLAHLRQSNGTRLRPSPLIWVDDRPVGNSKEASELRALGLDVKQVTSTAEALAIATEGAHTMMRDHFGIFSFFAAASVCSTEIVFVLCISPRSPPRCS